MDNETYLITRLRPAPKVVCTSMWEGAGEVKLVAGRKNLQRCWEESLADDSVEIVGLNIAYDMCTIITTFPHLLEPVFKKYRKNLVTDVDVRQQIFDIAVGNALSGENSKNYSLAELVRLIFDESMPGKKGKNIWRLRYNELDGVPLNQWPREAIDYAKNDARQTWLVWAAQNEAQDKIRYEHERAYINFVLALIQNYGMRTNAEAVARCRAEHEKTIASLQPGLIECGLIALDKTGKTTKKAKPARDRIIAGCLAQGNEPPLTKTGMQRKRQDPSFTWRDEPKFVATDKVACLLSQDEMMLKRLQYANAEKTLSTYIPVVEAGIDGPVTTRFGIAATGRTTSRTPTLPQVGSNFQNAPRTGGIRECYYPREGKVFIAADVGGAELHTLAQKCKNTLGYSVLGDMLSNNQDPHLFVASKLLLTSFNDVVVRYRAGDSEAKKARQDAKAANFGFPGGMRERTFIINQIKQREKFWKYEDVVKLRNAWLDAFPEMREYFDHCKRELGPRGKATIEIPGTRMLRMVQSMPQCANSHFQGPAAGGALAALCEVSRRCYTVPNSALYRVRPCNFIHDEILGEADEDTAHDAALEMQNVMETEFTKFTPDYPVVVEPVLMRYWSKGAKQIFNEDGRLIPWPQTI
jgi:DNA polymerase I-like protein with 3'-5' exonuclease and polymerase domains